MAVCEIIEDVVDHEGADDSCDDNEHLFPLLKIRNIYWENWSNFWPFSPCWIGLEMIYPRIKTTISSRSCSKREYSAFLEGSLASSSAAQPSLQGFRPRV